MKFSSNSKYFRPLNAKNIASKRPISSTETFITSIPNSVSIKEDDELVINCTVSSSKPAADISIWMASSYNSNQNSDDMKKIDISDFYTNRNKDYTLKSIAVAKYKVSRNDNLKFVTCIAENVPLDEKWETKRALNVLCKLTFVS